MTLSRWNDERIDDLKTRVDTLEPALRAVVEHEVTLEEHTRTLASVAASQTQLGERLDASQQAYRWTPAAMGPIIVAAIAVVGAILTKGG